MFLPDKFSDYFSVAAVIVSLASFAVSLRTYLRDVSRIRLIIALERNMSNRWQFRVQVTNVGRRPVTLARIYALLEDAKIKVVYDSPILLDEAHSKDVFVTLSGLELTDPLRLHTFVAEDSAGKRYSVNACVLRWQIRKARSAP